MAKGRKDGAHHRARYHELGPCKVMARVWRTTSAPISLGFGCSLVKEQSTVASGNAVPRKKVEKLRYALLFTPRQPPCKAPDVTQPLPSVVSRGHRTISRRCLVPTQAHATGKEQIEPFLLLFCPPEWVAHHSPPSVQGHETRAGGGIKDN